MAEKSWFSPAATEFCSSKTVICDAVRNNDPETGTLSATVTIRRRPSQHASNQQRNQYCYLSCACAMCLASPLLRDCRNWLNEIVVAYRFSLEALAA